MCVREADEDNSCDVFVAVVYGVSTESLGVFESHSDDTCASVTHVI